MEETESYLARAQRFEREADEIAWPSARERVLDAARRYRELAAKLEAPQEPRSFGGGAPTLKSPFPDP